MKKILILVVLGLSLLVIAGCRQKGAEDYISADRAKEVALTESGLTADDVTFVRADLDRDDGRRIYEVEFYTKDFVEYDYEIDAKTGKVISFDADAEGYATGSQSAQDAGGAVNIPSEESVPTQSEGAFTEADAVRIALVEVPGATENDARVRTDYDDGIKQYDVTIVYNSTEYEFEIDAKSGVILERDSDSVFDD